MGNVHVVNETNIAVNFGMYVGFLYNYINEFQPHQMTDFDIGCVWFSFEVIPWYGPQSKFDANMWEYDRLKNRIPAIAEELAADGEYQFFDLKFICYNCNEGKGAEQLEKLLFWEHGFYPCKKKYCIAGGPGRSAVINSTTIDLTEDFQKLRVKEC